MSNSSKITLYAINVNILNVLIGSVIRHISLVTITSAYIAFYLVLSTDLIKYKFKNSHKINKKYCRFNNRISNNIGHVIN